MLHRSLHLLLALVTALLAPDLAFAAGTEQSSVQVIDGYTITIALPPDRIQTGPNDLTVMIRTAHGTAVTDAAVSVAIVAYGAEDTHGGSHSAAPADSHSAAPADSHSAAPADSHGTDHTTAPAASHTDTHATDDQGHEAIPTMLTTGSEPGTYTGVLHLDQAGTATLTVAFTIAGQEHAALFAVSVLQARPRALVIGGFIAINGLAILVAAILKRRMPQKQRTSNTVRPAMIPLTAPSAVIEEEHSR